MDSHERNAEFREVADLLASVDARAVALGAADDTNRAIRSWLPRLAEDEANLALILAAELDRAFQL